MYHVIKFSPYFSFTVDCFYTKISSFMLVLSTRIVLDFFYLLIFYSEKFSTDVCRLPYAVNVNLNLSIVIKSPLCALCCIVHTANMEIRSFINWSLTRGLKQLKQRKIIKPALQKVIVVAYQRWSFMRGSNYRVLTGNIFVLWKGGRLQER